MSSSLKSVTGAVLQGVAWIFFAAAGIAFLWGGRAISEFTKTDRLVAEGEGLGLMLAFVALGALATRAGEGLEEENDSTMSEDEPVQK